MTRIGHRALPPTYRSIVPDVLLEAVLEQTYSVDAVERCIHKGGDDAHFLVAEREGSVAGFLHFDNEPGEPELHRIYLHPDLTGQGIGRRLLGGLHSRLAPGSSYILMVVAANLGARRFYAREGFEEESRVDARSFYAEHMGLSFPPDVPRLESIVLRRTIPRSESAPKGIRTGQRGWPAVGRNLG